MALTEDWPAAWLVLRTADGWPTAARAILPEIADDVVGKRRWLGRRYAMRRLVAEFSKAGCADLEGGTRLMATDPTDAHACGDVAMMLAAELCEHNIGDDVGPVIAGWAALAHGWSVVGEQDPIKAARLAYEGEREYQLSRPLRDSCRPSRN